MTTTMDTPTTAPATERPTHTSLYTALFAFQQEMPTVAKTKTARVPTKTGGSYSYSYADLAVIHATATPILARHGLMFVSTPAPGTHGYELIGHVIHAESGQELTGSLPLFGTNAQDIGGSITYMRRYLMGCLTGIITDADTDAVEAPAQRAQQQDPHRPPVQRMSQDQFNALVQWQESGTNLTTVFWDVLKRAASSDDMTFDEAARVLEYLHQREEQKSPKG